MKKLQVVQEAEEILLHEELSLWLATCPTDPHKDSPQVLLSTTPKAQVRPQGSHGAKLPGEGAMIGTDGPLRVTWLRPSSEAAPPSVTPTSRMIAIQGAFLLQMQALGPHPGSSMGALTRCTESVGEAECRAWVERGRGLVPRSQHTGDSPGPEASGLTERNLDVSPLPPSLLPHIAECRSAPPVSFLPNQEGARPSNPTWFLICQTWSTVPISVLPGGFKRKDNNCSSCPRVPALPLNHMSRAYSQVSWTSPTSEWPALGRCLLVSLPLDLCRPNSGSLGSVAE